MHLRYSLQKTKQNNNIISQYSQRQHEVNPKGSHAVIQEARNSSVGETHREETDHAGSGAKGSEAMASSIILPPSRMSGCSICDRSSTSSNVVPSGASPDMSSEPIPSALRTVPTSTPTPILSSSCFKESSRTSGVPSFERGGWNEMESGCGLGEETLDGTSSFNTAGSETSLEAVVSGGTDCAGSSGSNSSSPSAPSGSSGSGASGSSTPPSSSLNCYS